MFAMTEKEHSEILAILDNPVALAELEKTMPNAKSYLQGKLLSSWMPMGVARRILMGLFILIGILGVIFYNRWMFIFIPLVGIFSPRLVGEVAYLYGKIRRSLG
jgi:hypothetical protein